MFQVTGLKILGRVGIHIFFNLIFCQTEMPFKMHKIIIFSRKPEKNPRFHQ